MNERTQKLYEEIADKLMGRIRQGELLPGDRLPSERYLASEYHVSRAVIREAFRSMERMGCVESRVGEGTFVKAPEIADIMDPLSIIFSQDAQFADELIETRLILETEIVRLASSRRTQEQLVEMHQTLREMQREILKGNPGVAYDSKFHFQLSQAAGNRALTLVLSMCQEVLSRSMEVTQRVEGASQRTMIDHENILKAVEEQNAEQAEYYMRSHLKHAQINLQKAREKKGQE